MAKQIKIKEIAKMAGVSAGTVDRIIHNRGHVSPESQAAVEQALAETGYKYNLHTSAISLKREYSLIITIPTAVEGEYWGFVQKGIEHALEEYSDIAIDHSYAFYNQFDIFSCKSAFERIPDMKPSAVLIGATFASETRILCRRLEDAGIPYAFVDSVIEDTHPSVSYSSDQNICGRIVGRLLNLMTPRDSELAIFSTRRIGNERALNSMARMTGLHAYFKGIKSRRVIKESKVSVIEPATSRKDILDFLQKNPDVKGIAVLNSRGYILADTLAKNGINDVKVVTFDLTVNNMRCIQDGTISAIIGQRPELQGFHAVKAMLRILLYNIKEKDAHHLMPTDIIIKENLPVYKEIFID